MRCTRIVPSLLCLLCWAPGAGAFAASLDSAKANDLILANHVLVQQGVVDVRGHISVRDPQNPQHFWITSAIAPGLAAIKDLQEFDLDGHQMSGSAATPYTERFIHARIYKARLEVQSIVHAHTASLTTFSVSGIAIVPVMIGGNFAHAGVPVFVNGSFGEGVHDIPAGDALARTLGDKTAVLMRGHGAVVVGSSIQSAVGRLVGLDADAKMQMAILAMGGRPIVLQPPQNSIVPENYDREWSWWKTLVKPPQD